MPQESQLAHRVLTNLALPYISNTSPATTEPHYVPGSSDILTSINNYAERRPGFATAVEPTPTTFNNLQRLFTWDRFDGTFIVMFCDINSSNQPQVYKMQVGSDASAVSLFTGTNAAPPFDFVVSNNTVYFSNGVQAKKWDPVNGVSNWGIAIGSVNNITGPNQSGAGANGGGGGIAWTNPNNITSLVSNASVAVPSGNVSQELLATMAGNAFSIPSVNTITGIQVSVNFGYTATGGTTTGFQAILQLLKSGVPVGTSHFAQFNINPLAQQVFTFGGTSDLWGTNWTFNDVNQATFGFQLKVTSVPGRTTSWVANSGEVTIYSLGGPPISVLAAAGTMNAAAGYVYVFCYGNSNTGHISSPTPPSLNTGVFTNKSGVQVTLTASTDPQVNQIRVFRTTDGGGGTYFELPTSPYPNTSGNITDSANDTQLQVGSVAPTPTFNDPPTPFQSPVYFSGRIWGFKNNKVYFSGLEEINQGVPEESFPSGIAGNFWSFDETVQGLGTAGIVANQTLGILCGGRLYGIQGNTLDTFRRFLVSNRRGCRNLTCVNSIGGMMAWLDSANQVWATDGNSLNELSPPIRPDLTSITQANCSLTFHTSGRFHWLVLSTGTQLLVYDIDQDQWMPPWSFAATYVFSGETSPGNYVLMASNGTKALQSNTSAFNDNGATYQPILKTSLLSVIPDYGTRFSYIGMGSYNEPSRTGYPVVFQVTNNGQAISDFLICSDENTATATYTSIAANLQDTVTAFNRTNGTSLKQLVYPTTSPAARWIGMQVKLANADQVDNVYELYMAYKPLGGR